MSKQELEYNESRKLICELTDAEVKERGEELAQELKGITELEVERARVNAKIKPKQQRVEQLVAAIDTKREEREVECDWCFEWSKGVKVLVRSDTFEEVQTTQISEEERQIKLELELQED